MGKIISVVGNLGAGKTTLTRLLCEQGPFTPCWERPDERPFHSVFAQDISRWALANQVDFFLFRCQQESIARQSSAITVFDGGFDQDFHVFTRHLLNTGYLIPDEFAVCQRFYHFARELLPPPDIIIRIVVDFPTLLQRRLSRGRKTVDQSFSAQELAGLERLLDEWLAGGSPAPVLQFAFERDQHCYAHEIEALSAQIKAKLHPARRQTRGDPPYQPR